MNRVKITKPERLYSVAEIAKLWSCSRQHVYNLIASGQLASVQATVAKRAWTRVPESDLAAYVARHRTPARAA